MLNAETFDKYYKNVSKEEVRVFRDFLDSHPLKQLEFNGQTVEYYCCGKGERTIFFAPGGMGILPPEIGFRYILEFEKKFKVIAPCISNAGGLDELSDQFNRILDTEGTDNVVVTGTSGAGIFAQSYFKRSFERIDALILTNTIAPSAERNKKIALRILRLMPVFLLKILFKKKRKAFTAPGIPPELKEKFAFSGALFNEIISEQFNKKMLLSQLKLVFEFNEKDNYKPGDFEHWKGKVLIVTAEDDPGYKDVDSLLANHPGSESYTFPKGSGGHLAPSFHMETYFSIIEKFLEKRGRCVEV